MVSSVRNRSLHFTEPRYRDGKEYSLIEGQRRIASESTYIIDSFYTILQTVVNLCEFLS